MSKKDALLLCASTAIAIAGFSCTEQSMPICVKNNITISPASVVGTDLVSTDWLYSNLDNDDYTIIDLRSADDFSNGHIPNSINIPFDVISVWATSDFAPGGLWVELPEISALTTALGEYGIKNDSKVVLVTALPVQNPYSLGAPGRVALTLAYAGLKHAAFLDGAYEKWTGEEKPVTTEPSPVTPVMYNYESAPDLFVDMNYVENNLSEIVLVDARDADVYAGAVTEPWALKAGHIPTAVSLPASSLWNTDDGTYKSLSEIETIAEAAIGTNRNQNIVVYCGVGGYAGTVWFALTEILHYKNVKVYDGSAQEWAMTNDMEM